jgi:methylthioribose-1-phosphate isomerase
MLPEIPTDTRVTEIAEIVQLAVAPVFLLAGIGAFLNACASRLARIVERARSVEPKLLGSRGAEHDRLQREIRILDRRMALVSRAMVLTVISAVLTCTVVVLLFAGSLLDAEFGTVIALLFIATMIALGLGFFVFLLETRLASRAVRIRAEILAHEAEDREE